MTKIKVACYARVSTSSLDQANSFENQKIYFEREITKNPDNELIKIYTDKGISATSTNRPGFLDLLYDAGIDCVNYTTTVSDPRKQYQKLGFIASAREPKFNLIYVKNTSRFARNVSVVDVLRELKKNKVYVYFLDLGKSTELEESITFVEIFMTMDERESADKSKKIIFGHFEGATRGVINTSDNIYGFRYIKATNSLEIVPKEAEVIRQIFTLYSEGQGIRRILNYLGEHGLKTRRGKEFAKSTISKILANEKYSGILVRNKYTTGVVFQKNTYPKLRDKAEWIYHEDRIPAIVTKKLFDKCQEIREGKINTINQKGVYKGLSEYAELIRCDKCGSSYTRNIDRGRVFYNCSNKKMNGIKSCDNINVNLKYLEDSLIKIASEYSNHLYSSKKVLITYCENVKLEISQKIDKRDEELIENKTISLNKLVDNRNYLHNMFFFENNIEKSYYLSAKDRFDIEIHELEEELKELNKNNNDLNTELDQIDKIIIEIDNIDTKKSYTVDEIKQEVISYKIRRAKDIQSGYQEISTPEIIFKFKLNEYINYLSAKYIKDFKNNRSIEDDSTVLFHTQKNSVVQIFSNGGISIYLK